VEQITSKDGTLLAYARSGQGPPLVLVHGATADHTRWAPVSPALEQHYTLYALDRRGRGGSGDAANYALEYEYADVVTIVEMIGTPVNLLGHSFGAACALEAVLSTRSVARLILYEPPPSGVRGTLSQASAERMRADLASGNHDAVVTTFLQEVAGVPAHELQLLRSAPAWQARVAAAHTILREIEALEQSPPFDAHRFAGMATPTLLLLGGDSPAFYRYHITALHAALVNSRIVEMPGQRHVAMNTAPELFVREVLSFLALAA
jgi:pimeloyl-ACP methyl ester carboxylesterase